MSVEPYREITFDKDGDGPAGQSAALTALARQGVTDLVLLAHGWNNSPSGATRLCSDFFAPFPGLFGPGVEAGYAGVIWPSMIFTDEPVPDYRALVTVLPEKEPVLVRLTELLTLAPPEEAAFVEFGELLRELTDVYEVGDGIGGGIGGGDEDGGGIGIGIGDGIGDGIGGVGAVGAEGVVGASAAVPEFLVADPVAVCARFTEALEETGGTVPPEGFGEGLKRYWKGAREALRQAAYYVMKRRAGRVGEFGLGPLLGEVARTAPGLRVHLVGHSMGARLVAYALRGLPPGARPVASVTLLQGAFSHYAFAPRLPHDPRRPGSLRDMQHRVRGPLVACYSRHDTALGVMYPLASRLAGDSESLAGPLSGQLAGPLTGLLGADDPRWGAIGHDGVKAVPGTVERTLAAVLREGVPGSGCVSVDAADAVRSHSDIVRPELARVVVSAARAGRA
ncbi:serine-threonine protein kinase [Streptomyces sp. NBC_00094]|uniref:serine-threonine protein kinase n=1 Tax=Streptomyces sp. NBC_00094 TaxID=2903620 RepID=UPI002259104D|nr:serine-threonine protein kinase [Streptomyces sp. NBC_00094]MCX5389742.1 serine-threonine protein kinase [Streptomyces sp. NBC_00094]